jgi:hypothetical protein
MATEKTFDKADLLRFFHDADHDATVGKFTVIHPPSPAQLAFDREAETGETIRYPVVAQTTALYCDRYDFSLCVQSVIFTDGGNQYLPKDEPLRVLASQRRVTTRYGGTSAQLVRWAVELAEEWRSMVRYALPLEPIDRRVQRSNGRGNGRSADPDHTPTGETIDDVFREHNTDDTGAEDAGAEGGAA